MSDSKAAANVSYEVWATHRIRHLREEADVLEANLLQYQSDARFGTSFADLSSAPKPANRAPRAAAKPPVASKYAPLIAAWESKPDVGLTHGQIYDLARKTVSDCKDAGAVKSFVFLLSKDGRVRRENGKYFIATERARRRTNGESQHMSVDG